MHFPWAGHDSGEELKLGVVDVRKESFTEEENILDIFGGSGKATENFRNDIEENL